MSFRFYRIENRKLSLVECFSFDGKPENKGPTVLVAMPAFSFGSKTQRVGFSLSDSIFDQCQMNSNKEMRKSMFQPPRVVRPGVAL